MSCPKSPMTNYWHSVNEKCPTRLPATQSYCVSCGTPRPGSAYSSHTDGPKEDEVRVDLRPRITSKMVNTILLSRPKGSTNPQRKASVPAHQRIVLNRRTKPKITMAEARNKRQPEKKSEMTAAKQNSKTTPGAEAAPEQTLSPQAVIPIHDGPIRSSTKARVVPQSYYSLAKLSRTASFQGLPRSRRKKGRGPYQTIA